MICSSDSLEGGEARGSRRGADAGQPARALVREHSADRARALTPRPSDPTVCLSGQLSQPCTNVHVLVSPFHTLASRHAPSPTSRPSSFFKSYLFAKNCTSIHHHSRLAASYSALCYLFEFLKGCVQCSRLPLDHRAKVSSFLLLLVVVVDAPARPEQTTRIHRRQRCT